MERYFSEIGLSKIATSGRGAFGSVDVCRSLKSDQIIAVKYYEKNSVQGRAVRVMDEKRVLQQICGISPYVIRLIDTKQDAKYLYFILEACLAGSLHLHISSHIGSKLPPSIARGYCAQIMAALMCLASRNCLHRDLKATNVLLDHHGQIKICDFGSAKLLESVTSRTYSIIGSAHNMAPEMVGRSLGYNWSVDWWALGVLMYEMLTGELPEWATVCSSEVYSEDRTLIWPTQDDSAAVLELIESECHHGASTTDVRPTTTRQKASTHYWKSTYALTILKFYRNHDYFTADCADVWALPPRVSEYEQGMHFVRWLLTADPSRRPYPRTHSESSNVGSIAGWSSSGANGGSIPFSESFGNIMRHPFFAIVSENATLQHGMSGNGCGGVVTDMMVDRFWNDVCSGTSQPANPHFDRRLGLLEVMEAVTASHATDSLSEDEQHLFSGF